MHVRPLSGQRCSGEIGKPDHSLHPGIWKTPTLSRDGLRPWHLIGWALLRGPREGLLWAVAGGVCVDLLSSGPFGLATVSLVAACMLARLGHGRAFGGYMTIPLLAAFPLSLVYYGACTLLLFVSGRPIALGPALGHIILPASLYNMLVMAVLFPLLHLLHQRTGRQGMRW